MVPKCTKEYGALIAGLYMMVLPFVSQCCLEVSSPLWGGNLLPNWRHLDQWPVLKQWKSQSQYVPIHNAGASGGWKVYGSGQWVHGRLASLHKIRYDKGETFRHTFAPKRFFSFTPTVNFAVCMLLIYHDPPSKVAWTPHQCICWNNKTLPLFPKAQSMN